MHILRILLRLYLSDLRNPKRQSLSFKPSHRQPESPKPETLNHKVLHNSQIREGFPLNGS